MPNPTSPTNPITDDTLRAATAAAERVLTAPARLRAAISYLAQRGIDGAALPPEWPLGYAPPGWTRLTDTLRADGFDDQTLLDAGLARRCSRGTLIDVFRDRIIFPIHDHNHTAVGFLGRDLSGGPAAPKYLNTRDTPLYTKGALLYGLNERDHDNTSQPVLVEGPLDVLAITARAAHDDQRLLPVATCGTGLTHVQARLITELAEHHNVPVTIAMDGDTAGRGAAITAGQQLHRLGADIRIATLPNGTDPASYLANPRHTLDAFHDTHTLPLLTVQIQHCIAEQGDHLQWVEGRVAAARGIARILNDYPPERAITQTGWISDVLDIAPATFTGILANAYHDAGRLPVLRDGIMLADPHARATLSARRVADLRPQSPTIAI